MTTSVHRLFLIPPDAIYEHPVDLPTDPALIPDGPIEGWLCYAPNYHGDRSQVLGPFRPVVSRPYRANEPVIEVGDEYSKTQFFFADGNGEHFTPQRVCWCQSGATLRWVRE